jgi:hypothetical protein
MRATAMAIAAAALAFMSPSALLNSQETADRHIAISKVGDDVVWQTPPDGRTAASELLANYADFRGVVIVHRPDAMHGFIDWEGDIAGKQFKGAAIDALVADQLERFPYYLADQGAGFISVIPATEAASMSRATDGELTNAKRSTEWVTTFVFPKHLTAGRLAALFGRQWARSGTMVEAFDADGVLLSERADRMPELLALVRGADDEARMECRSFNLPESLDTEPALKTLRAQFSDHGLDFVALPKTRKLLVRARPSDMDAIAAALRALE